ncbi:MAG: hypothetical protein AB2693_35190 [Candidatus Thiodiazotropha sp.]
MSWKGPYEVMGKLSPLDYRVKVGRKVKTFHINMFKQYIERKERETEESQEQTADMTQTCAITVLDMSSEVSNIDELSESLMETHVMPNEDESQTVSINPDLSAEKVR